MRAKKIHEEYLAALDEYFVRHHAVAPRPGFSARQTSPFNPETAEPRAPSRLNLTPVDKLRLTRLSESALQRDMAQEVCDLSNKTDAKLASADDYATLNEHLNKAFFVDCKNRKNHA